MPEPEFALSDFFLITIWRKAGEVTGEVGTKLALSRHQVLSPLMDAGLLEMTIPDKPRSSKQQYRLTEKGRALLASLQPKQGKNE